MIFDCPHCSQSIEADDASAGSVASCPVCSQSFVLPTPAQKLRRAVIPPPLPPATATKPTSKKAAIIAIGTTIVMVFVGSLAKVIVREQPPKPYSLTPASSAAPSTTIPAAPTTWRQYSLAGLSLDLPTAPRPKTIKLPPQAAGFIASVESHEAFFGGGQIGVTHTRYVSNAANLDGAVSSAIDALRNLSGVSAFVSEVAPVTTLEIAAKKVTIGYDSFGYKKRNISLFMARDRELWQVVVVGSAATPDNVAERVISSVSVNP